MPAARLPALAAPARPAPAPLPTRTGHDLAVALARIPGRNELERRRIAARLLELWQHLQAPRAGKSLRQLAAVSGYSPCHLQRLFKHVFGIAPHTLATRRRLEEAADLLWFTDEPVPVVCRRAGFVNRCAFARLFKRSYGLSPSDYRGARAAERDFAASLPTEARCPPSWPRSHALATEEDHA